jgi:hypothetical protein
MAMETLLSVLDAVRASRNEASPARLPPAALSLGECPEYYREDGVFSS